jgi:hypothetical protein
MTLTSVTAMPRALRVVALRVAALPVARLVALRVAALPVDLPVVALLVALPVPALPVAHFNAATRFHWQTFSHPYLMMRHRKDSNMHLTLRRL